MGVAKDWLADIGRSAINTKRPSQHLQKVPSQYYVSLPHMPEGDFKKVMVR